MKTTRCTDCRAEFTDEEIKDARACPKCGSQGVPMYIGMDLLDVHINWHELRIITIWAENWARSLDEASQRTLKGIIDRLEKQHRKVDWPSLSLFGEIQEIADETGNKATLYDEDGKTTDFNPTTKH